MGDGSGFNEYGRRSSGGGSLFPIAGAVRTLIEAVPDGAFVADGDGRIITANARLEAALGYDSGGLAGDPLTTFLPDPPAAVREPGDAGPADEPIPVLIRTAGGAERRASVSLSAHRHAGTDLLVGVFEGGFGRDRVGRSPARYETLLDAVDDGIYVLGPSFEILEVNEAMASMTGYDREALLGADASVLADDDVLEEAARLIGELRHSDREAASITAEITTAGGDRLPIETRFSLFPFEDGEYGQVGVVRDITDREQFEETLTALHRSTRRLLGAESIEEIGGLLVDTATDAIDLSTAVVYRFDVERNVLEPVAGAGAGIPGDDPGSLAVVEPGEHPCWTAFVEGRTVETAGEGGAGRTLPVAPEVYVPLDDTGVFVAGGTDGDEFDDEMRTILDLLAANVEAALDRVDREETLRERERELQEQNRRLRRLDRINEVIRDIDAAVVGADTIDGIADAVCERLVGSEWFEFAWIGEPDPVEDEIRPRAWAGEGRGYLDEVPLALSGDDHVDGTLSEDEPAVRALHTETVVREPTVADDLRAGAWRTAALSRDFRSVVALPLQYDGLTRGVLAAYARSPEATDEVIRTVLVELGETVTSAMSAVETRHALLADGGIELTLRFDASEDPIFRLAGSTSCHLHVESVVPQVDGSTRIYFTTADGDTVRSFADRSVELRRLRTVAERDASSLFEAEVVEGTVASALADHGATIQSMAVEEGGGRVVVELPANADVRSFVARLRSRYPSVELVGRRRNERPLDTRAGLWGGLENRLTDRQAEVLRIAYHSGYFEWPRESTAEEIADSLDVSQPTISRHLRTAERELLTALFE